MIYIYNCNDHDLIQKKVKNITANKEVIKYELIKENIFQIINDILAIDLFASDKVYIFEPCPLLEIKSHGIKDKTVTNFIKAMTTSNNDYIFYIKKDLNKSSYFIKELNGAFEYEKIEKSAANSKTFIDEYINEHQIKIKENNLSLLNTNLDNNINAVINELEKLSLINPTGEITEEMILNNSYATVTADVFKFIEYIFLNDISNAKTLYEKLIEEGNKPVTLIELFATQIKFYYQLKLLSQDYSAKDITTLLKANPYRVRKTLTLVNKVSYLAVIKKYEQTAELEFLAKSGKINQDIIFDILIQN